MSDTARWQRLEDIFHTVVDVRAGAERDHRLLELCGSDEGLAAEVRALLEADAHLRDADPAVDPHLGLRLGHYQVDHLIARGGMASVYEAHRADDQFQQRVAIKICGCRILRSWRSSGPSGRFWPRSSIPP